MKEIGAMRWLSHFRSSDRIAPFTELALCSAVPEEKEP